MTSRRPWILFAASVGLVGAALAFASIHSPHFWSRPDRRGDRLLAARSFADAAKADRLSRELGLDYGTVNRRDASRPDGTPIQRIRVGSFPRLEDAQKAFNHLAKFCKDRGLESFITREE